MNLNKEWRIRLAQILFAGAILIALIVLRGIRAGDEPVHLTTDWSDRHVVLSGPKSLLQSLYLGRNPRYVQQWVRRYAERKDDGRGWRGHHNTLEELLHGDWNAYMGNVGTVGAGNYPARSIPSMLGLRTARLPRSLTSLSITRAWQGPRQPSPHSALEHFPARLGMGRRSS